MYHVSTGTKGGMYRLWSQQIAPNTAKTGVVIVNNEQVVRGQLGTWLENLTPAQKALLLAGVATAIIVPVAINQNDDDDAS